MAQVGPFFDENKLVTWLYEMAIRLSHAAVILASNPEGSDVKLLLTREHYLEVVNKWYSKYRRDDAPGGLLGVSYVDRIFRGEKPADLPVHQPINLRSGR